MQVLGLLIEVMGTSFGRYTSDVLPQCIQILEQANCPHDGDSDETERPVTWQDAYFSLTMMEKLLQKLPNMILQPDVKVQSFPSSPRVSISLTLTTFPCFSGGFQILGSCSAFSQHPVQVI